MSNRSRILTKLAEIIVGLNKSHPVRIAVDGVDAAGKTTLANELLRFVEDRGRPVIRASIDGFHRPRAERYRRGAASPEGYYFDSFDLDAIRSQLLLPLGPGGNREYRQATFGFRTDSPIEAPVRVAPHDAILLFDGVFLLRPELNECWDFRVFVAADFDVTLRRACQRDQGLLGSVEDILERYLKRYIPGQQLYLETVRPQEIADVVLENSDPENPLLSLDGHWP